MRLASNGCKSLCVNVARTVCLETGSAQWVCAKNPNEPRLVQHLLEYTNMLNDAEHVCCENPFVSKCLLCRYLNYDKLDLPHFSHGIDSMRNGCL